ncbi:MAG: tRNA guanosine(34) transglycosylase Tgt, partial [Waterburya sp.]
IMAFDECPPADATKEQIQGATDRSYRWLKRCITAHKNPEKQALFGIVQGGIHLDLRTRAVEQLAELNLPGYAIGGVSVGETTELINATVKHTAPLLPADKPRYLMGVGTYREMAQAIASGIDLFDCVIPTRLGRHGAVLVQGQRINIKNAQYKRDYQPLDPTCPCYACQNFSRAYLNHLVRSREMLGYMMLSLHNVTELIRFTQQIRQAIFDGTFSKEFATWLTNELR